MKNWKKLRIAIVALLAFSMISVKATAVQFTPSVQSVSPDTNVNIAVTASPSSDAVGIELRLRITNGQIISYTTPSTGGFLVLPACEGGTTFITTTDVCIDFANSGTFGTGTDLGTLVIRSGTSGTTTVEKITGNQYFLDAGGTETDEGVAGTYSIAASGPTSTSTPASPTPIVDILPQTAIDLSSDSFKTLIIGTSLIMIGFLISRYRNKAEEKT